MTALTQIVKNKCFGGWHERYTHLSQACQCEMTFAVFKPSSYGEKPLPVFYWLSGLTCTDENFMQKSGIQRIAEEQQIFIIAPDTSPRGDDVPNDEGYDLGQGAGFYLNATQEPWAKHFQMYDYIVDELRTIIEEEFNVSNNRTLAGHSMGGHGALTIGLKNPELFPKIIAYSPIVNPTESPWGQKAFAAYLGPDQDSWKEHDACELIKHGLGKGQSIQIHQGMNDQFLEEQLRLPNIELTAKEEGLEIDVHRHEGYDHSYFFIASCLDL